MDKHVPFELGTPTMGEPPAGSFRLYMQDLKVKEYGMHWIELKFGDAKSRVHIFVARPVGT